MSNSATWLRKLQAARAADPALGRRPDPSLETAIFCAMTKIAPNAALLAAARSHDAALTLALALDMPAQQPMSWSTRLRTLVMRAQHRHYEDAIAAANVAVRSGAGIQFVAANANDALRLVILRDALAGFGVPEEQRSMGNWELLSLIFGSVCVAAGLILLAARAAS